MFVFQVTHIIIMQTHTQQPAKHAHTHIITCIHVYVFQVAMEHAQLHPHQPVHQPDCGTSDLRRRGGAQGQRGGYLLC